MTHLRVNKSTTDKKSTIKTVNCYPFKKNEKFNLRSLKVSPNSYITQNREKGTIISTSSSSRTFDFLKLFSF